MKKILAICQSICEIVPEERLNNIINVALFEPVSRAGEKLGNENLTDVLKPIIDAVMENYSPTTMAMLAFASIAKSNKTAELEQILDSLDADTINRFIEKLASSIENNAGEIGDIIEHAILVGNSIKNDMSSDDDEITPSNEE